MKAWTDFIKPAVILSIICAVTSGLLAFTNDLTLPIITQNEIDTANAARMALLPADGFEKIEGDYENISEIYKATDDSGYVITAFAQGYAGEVPVMAAFSEGKLLGVTFLANSETPGLGQKVRDDKFAQQFTDTDAKDLTISDVDVIAGATITTNAAITAINSAVEAFMQLEGVETGVDLTVLSEEQVHELVLPNSGTLTEIEVNGAQKAFKGESYGTILYISENGFFSSPLVATIGFDDDGNIVGTWFNAENESKGYGSQVGESADFAAQFTGEQKNDYEIIAGATVSSNAAIKAIETAYEIWNTELASMQGTQEETQENAEEQATSDSENNSETEEEGGAEE